jgi:hypothetical protein
MPIPIRFPGPVHYAAALALTFALNPFAAQAAVQASLSENPAYLGEPLLLSIASDDTSGSAQPDLSPLESDFQVLGTGTSTQINIINGQRSDKMLWQVQLAPKHSGTLRIPALTVGNEATDPLTVTVKDSASPQAQAAGSHVFLQAELDPAVTRPYVQQLIPYTVRLYYDRSLRQGSLEPPQLDNAVIEQIGEDRQYETSRDGRRLQVVERHYALFPQSSGHLTIPPVRFEGQVLDESSRTRHRGASDTLMQRMLANTPFANDPFFRDNMFSNDAFGGLFSSSVPVRTQGPAVSIEVRPRPAGSHGAWLPAAQVTLHDDWSEHPPELRVGEPVTRSVTIRAEGLGGAQIPALDMIAPANARLYPEPPVSETRTENGRVVGISTQKLTYIPTAEGNLELPELQLPWWDTTQDHAATATLPAWRLLVAAGSVPQAGINPQPLLAPPSAPLPAATADADDSAAGSWRERLPGSWHWAAVGVASLLALAVLLLVAGVRRRNLRQQPPAPAAPPATGVVSRQASNPTARAARQALKQACQGGDGAAAARALLQLARSVWPDDPPGSLGALASRVPHGSDTVRELDRWLYTPGDTPWQGQALWAAVDRGLAERPEPGSAAGDDGLPAPLYPRHA